MESHGASEMFHIYNANKKMARTLCFVIIRVYFTLLWGVTSVWMFLNVRAEFRQHSYYRRVAMVKLYLEQGGKRVTDADRIDKRLALLRNIRLATVVPLSSPCLTASLSYGSAFGAGKSGSSSSGKPWPSASRMQRRPFPRRSYRLN